MSIADKLKKTLSETILFNKEQQESEDVSITTSNNEDAEKISEETIKSNIASINPKIVKENKFKDMAEVLVNKIKNTPYWAEYTMKSQEKMISKYFDKKIKSKKYIETPYSLTDKLTFIEEVLKSVV